MANDWEFIFHFLTSNHYAKIIEINKLLAMCRERKISSNIPNQVILNPIFLCLAKSAISSCFHNFLIKNVNRFSNANSVIYPEH